MKKIILIQSIIIVALLISCNDEEFLDVRPLVPTDASFYESEEGALQAINAVYDIMQLGEQVQRAEFFGDVCSGDATAGGEPGGQDQPPMQNMMRFLTNSSNQYCLTYWRALYRGIYRCNMITSKLEKKSIDEFDDSLRERIVGEAKFMRALYLFKLQVMYGGMPQLQDDFDGKLLGIPTFDAPLQPSEYRQERPAMDFTYKQIEEDLQDAALLLPEKSEYLDEDLGRATRGAALALLTKVYIYQEKWQQALANAEIVINSGEYWLEGGEGHEGSYTVLRTMPNGVRKEVEIPAYRWIFAPEGDNSGGSIFEIQHGAFHQAGNVYPEGGEGNLMVQYYNPRQYFNESGATRSAHGWGFINPTDYFVNTAYKRDPQTNEIVDPRYELTVIEDCTLVSIFIGGTVGVDSVPIDGWFASPTGRHNWKYWADPDVVNSRTALNDHPHNYKYMRYADLLLLSAEAAIHEQQEPKALTWINMVRTRARNMGNTGSPGNLTSVTLQDVWAERRIELAFEGHRWFDLVRTKQAETVLKNANPVYGTNSRSGAQVQQQFGENFTKGKNEVFPIHQQEIDLSGGLIKQNPNY